MKISLIFRKQEAGALLPMTSTPPLRLGVGNQGRTRLLLLKVTEEKARNHNQKPL